MVSRREVLAGGVVGSLVAAPEAAAAQSRQSRSQGNCDAYDEIRDAIYEITMALRGPSLSSGPIPKIRQYMEGFLKGNSKFPDFIDVGCGVFFDMYDWHIRHGRELIVTRQSDGRYTLQFMFTMLMLRQEVEPGFIGIPYDKA